MTTRAERLRAQLDAARAAAESEAQSAARADDEFLRVAERDERLSQALRGGEGGPAPQRVNRR